MYNIVIFVAPFKCGQGSHITFPLTVEAIPHGRLSSPETIGRDELCVACNTPLRPCLRRFTPDPFDANEVSAQEETPFGNPTEAQV